MAELEIPTLIRDLFPEQSSDVQAMLARALHGGSLGISDFYTIHDWLEVADYHACEPLVPLLLAMLLAHHEGSLCIEATVENLTRRLSEVCETKTQAREWSRRILLQMETDPCVRLIGTSPDDHRPVILYHVGRKRFFYFQRFLRAERLFHDDLIRRLAAAPLLESSNDTRKRTMRRLPDLAAVLDDILVKNPLRRNGKPLELDREQRWAAALGLAQPLTIISGGPGTGKTSIVLTLLRGFLRLGVAADRIALAAPTGRAAQRLTDSLRSRWTELLQSAPHDSPDHALTSISAQTLHRLLGYRPSSSSFAHHLENPISADVVVIDEVSMVGLVLMARLFQSMTPTTRVVLLGDKDQLPSVDAGAVLANLVPENVTFTPVMRSILTSVFEDADTSSLKSTMTMPRTTKSPRHVGSPKPAKVSRENDVVSSEAPADWRVPVVLLRTNHRSQANIRDAAERINRQDTTVLSELPRLSGFDDWSVLEKNGGCWLLEQTEKSASEIRRWMWDWSRLAYFERHDGRSFADLLRDLESRPLDFDRDGNAWATIFSRLDRFRVLTLVREGPWGAADLNAYLESIVRPRLDPTRGAHLFSGAPVLITRNDARLELNNGDVGLAIRLSDDDLRVVFPQGEGFQDHSVESLPSYELGFALTVHKSQGSEYDHVLTVLPPHGAGERLLTKELPYTAITRARQVAILCGTTEALTKCLERTWHREAGILSSMAEVPIDGDLIPTSE